jgi:hypothetical protein
MDHHKCFISCAIGTNINKLVKLLQKHNIEIVDFPESASQLSFTTAVETTIRDIDFVIAVLADTQPVNVIYQIGLARGMNKPVIILTGKNQKDVFWSVPSGILAIRATPDDEEAVEFNLEQFLSKQKMPVSNRISDRGSSTPLLSIERYERVIQSQPVKEAEIARELYGILSDDFTNRIQAEKNLDGPNTTRADLVVWLEELEGKTNNPVIIEIRAGELSQESLSNADQKLKSYLKISGSDIGLLVYSDRRGSRFQQKQAEYPITLWFEFTELLSAMTQQSLSRVILERRNSIVHGVL